MYQQQMMMMGGGGGGGDDHARTLWVGDIEQWMDEAFLAGVFSQAAPVAEVKMLRDKATGLPHGYAFLHFPTHEIAAQVLQSYNKQPLPGSGRSFRLNWASGSSSSSRRTEGPEFSVFVGDLSAEVSDELLAKTFSSHYSSVRNAKVVTDPSTGSSRGYGFVRFGDEGECNRALSEMQGMYIGSRPIRLATATPKKLEAQSVPVPAPAVNAVINDPSNMNNTTIFIGNLSPSVSEEELRGLFAPFGEMVYVRIPEGKGCGFVQYVHRASAENAMLQLHGKPIGPQPVRLSWGRASAAVTQPKPKMSTPTQYAPPQSYETAYQGYAYNPYQQYYPPQQPVQVINPYQHIPPAIPEPMQEEEDFTHSVQDIVTMQNEEFLAPHRMDPFLAHDALYDHVQPLPNTIAS